MVQNLVNALSLGAVYALFAMGLSIAWAGLNVLNLAHGSIFMVGALTAWLLTDTFPGITFYVVLPVAVIVCAVLAWLMELLVFRPIRARAVDEHQRTLTTVIATVATSALLVAVAEQLTGGQPRGLPSGLFDVQTYRVGGVQISDIQIVIVAVAVVAAGAIAWFLSRSRQGRALRALSFDRDTAKLTGVSVDRLSALTITATGAVAGLAGVLLAVQVNAIDATMGESLLFKAFAVIIIAGVGSIGATVVAAVALAVVETLVIAYWVSDLRDVVVFALIIGFLLVRPQGIAGRGWQRA